jgi:hypothetical protein
MAATRKITLGIALAATLAAALLDWPAPEVAPSARAGVAAAVAAAAPAPAEPAPTLRERFEPQAADAFAPRNWPPPPPPPPTPEPPMAPPLPFKYLGKVMQEGEVMAFLGQGARTHLARAGDTLADYKVEEITTAEMTFVYLPLNEKQRLSFGSAN